LSQEDEEEKAEEVTKPLTRFDEYTDEEMEAGKALIMGLISTLQLEQSKAQLYFMLIPLAFSVGLLLGYYISFVNL
tara:strand:- start:42 stop:269 length:228 start_codon:yes stop_codon:yes gene_type:complete